MSEDICGDDGHPYTGGDCWCTKPSDHPESDHLCGPCKVTWTEEEEEEFGPLSPILPVPEDSSLTDPRSLSDIPYPITGMREALIKLFAGRDCSCQNCREDTR